MSPVIPSAAASKEQPSRARRPPNVLTSPSTRSTAAPPAPQPRLGQEAPRPADDQHDQQQAEDQLLERRRDRGRQAGEAERLSRRQEREGGRDATRLVAEPAQ